jgi:hypothetical protein
MKLNESGPTIVQVCQLWKKSIQMNFLHPPGVDTHHICNNSSYIDSYIMI